MAKRHRKSKRIEGGAERRPEILVYIYIYNIYIERDRDIIYTCREVIPVEVLLNC